MDFENQEECLQLSIQSPQSGQSLREISPIGLGNFQLHGSLDNPQMQPEQDTFSAYTDIDLHLHPYDVQTQLLMVTAEHNDGPPTGGDLPQDDISTWCEDLDLFFMPNEVLLT